MPLLSPAAFLSTLALALLLAVTVSVLLIVRPAVQPRKLRFAEALLLAGVAGLALRSLVALIA